jgi:hypothetical protein
MRRGEDMAAIMRQVWLMAGLALVMLAPAARSGPWPQAEGGGQLVMSTSFQHLNVQGYDSQGRPSGRGSLDQLSVSPYWEHGLTQRWTIGIAPRLQASWMDLGYTRSNSVGLADAALFARYAVWRDNGMVLSVQGTAVTPGTASTDSPRIAEAHGSVEGRALFGISRAIGSVNAFMGLEGAYRLRFGSNADEVRLDATMGFQPANGWFVFAQSLNTLGMRNATGNGANYSAYKAALAVSYSITPRHSIVAAYTRDLSGRNVALGDSYTLGWVYNY